MTTIDFHPSLFGPGSDPALPPDDSPIPTKSNFWSYFAISLLSASVVGVWAVVWNLASARPATSAYSVSSFRNPAIAANEPMPVPVRATSDIGSSGRKDDCNGDEIICATATASKPAEILKKLVAAIPKDGAKKYKVRLSVTPANEPTSEEGASDSAPTP